MPNSPFIVAEISSNHLGDLHRAFELIIAAKNAGADAIKFQTYMPNEIAADVKIESGPWAGRSYRSLYHDGRTRWDWHRELFTFARSLGIVPFSSPFSESAVEFLEKLDCPIYKIASPEIIHLPLIAAAAQTGKPLIISTGMADLSEIYAADDMARAHGATEITFLHCISAYPADPADFNLQTMVRLKHHNFHVGLSDHSLDNTAAIAATALGAIVIEKHLTLSRDYGGSDAKFSLEPDEFTAMVQAVRSAAKAMGTVQFGCRESEKDSYQYRRSVWLVKSIKRGEVITEGHLAILRPNYGANPSNFDIFVGMKAQQDLPAGTPMLMDYLK
jgi:N-acetylneuraminate synthase